MITEFFVKNYRNVNFEKMDLGKINILIGPNGSGKSNFLRALGFWAGFVQKEYDTFCEYRQMITPLFGKTQSIDLFIETLPTNDLLVKIGINRHQYILEDLSDGTIRAMLLAALLVDRKDKMCVCAIDEPELSLHPEWQSRFTDWLLTSNASQQFFISTHSPEILDPLTPAFMDGTLKVFVFSDTLSIEALIPEKIAELYEQCFNLGDLYRSKAIEVGGWPG